MGVQDGVREEMVRWVVGGGCCGSPSPAENAGWQHGQEAGKSQYQYHRLL